MADKGGGGGGGLKKGEVMDGPTMEKERKDGYHCPLLTVLARHVAEKPAMRGRMPISMIYIYKTSIRSEWVCSPLFRVT